MQATSYPPWGSMHDQIIYILLNFAGVGDSLVLEGNDEKKVLLDAGVCLSNALHYCWLVKWIGRFVMLVCSNLKCSL